MHNFKEDLCSIHIFKEGLDFFTLNYVKTQLDYTECLRDVNLGMKSRAEMIVD